VPETPAHVMRRADIRGGGRRRGRVVGSCGCRSARTAGVAVRERPAPGGGAGGDGCEVGPRRGAGLSTGPFPRTASRTRRAAFTATGSP